MDTSDRQLAMEELLDLLDEMGAGELGQLLRIENTELKTLRSQTHAYEQVIGELKQHLHNIFSVAGGLTTLPLSADTNRILGLVDAHSDIEGTAKDENLSEREALAQTVDDLRLTVAEQRTDINDLEIALRESRATVRALRSRLRGHELRQFAEASDCAGVGHLGSAAVDLENGAGLMAHHCAAETVDAECSALWSIGASDSESDCSVVVARGCDGCSLAVVPTDEPSVLETCASDGSASDHGADTSDYDDTHSVAAAATVSTRSTRINAPGVYLHYKHQMQSGGASAFASRSSGFSSAARLKSLVMRGPRRLYSSLTAKLRRSARAGPSSSLFNL
ncbi:hypothetical protein EV178_004435 [Coemansia sp. RSA 1646]|nr:hypothetical protein EV178_004435 [Coemansia sp. RSA 1646]